MSLRAVEGGAGCGKTTRLMEMLAEALDLGPLAEGQRILALTFMHGARRRLVDRLRLVPTARGRVECRTIDGFAWRLLRRWRGLAAALGVPDLPEESFNAVCDAAGLLVEHPTVRSWVAKSFPILIVDEGQDLSGQRLRMLRALAEPTETLIAADEFQCLDQTLRPNPLVTWLEEHVESEKLTIIHRTTVSGLLNAAQAIRAGNAPSNGQQFKIVAAPSHNLAAGIIANAIRWHPDSESVAVITPSPNVAFVREAIDRVDAGPIGAQAVGPYHIQWEGSDTTETRLLTDALNMEATSSAATTRAALHLLPRSGPVRATISWLDTQIHAAGRAEFMRTEIETVIRRQVTVRRQYMGSASHRYLAMTVQQAKNREFDGVIVIWPYAVGGDDEQKRRLLYNAITRARLWCTVIVQGQQIPAAAPFV